MIPIFIGLLDIAAIILAIVVSWMLYTWGTPELVATSDPALLDLFLPNTHGPSGMSIIVVWLLLLRASGLYDPMNHTALRQVTGATLKAGMGVLLFEVGLQFVSHETTWSRSLILSIWLTSTGSVMLTRSVFFRFRYRMPHMVQRVAILGVGAEAHAMATRLEEYGRHAYKLVGYVTPADGSEMFSVPADQVLGQVVHLGDLVNKHNIQVLVQTTQRLTRNESWVLADRADHMGVRLLQVPSTWGVANPRLDMAKLGGLQLIDLSTVAYPTRAEQFKRALDLVFVTIGGLVLLPLLIPVAVLIKASDGGPILFRQERSGRGGRQFSMLKFRSMVVGAEEQRPDLGDANETDGVLFKIADDPRVTPIGRWLRRWSIDELPQILNVIRGDMNLIGPRPLPIADLAGVEADAELKYWFDLRCKVKPGITGPWQVSGRSRLAMRDMVRLDIDYIQNWNLATDFVLLMRTIPAVLRRRGAQ